MRNKLIVLVVLMAHSIQVLALDSFSYSGRLVNSNGSPVTGEVNLRFDLSSTEDTSDILCSKTINNVPLSQGIFNVKLDFLPVDCENNSIQSIMESISSNYSLAYQVTDLTNSRTYSHQAIYSVPSSYMASFAKSLSSMGATITGQVLKWNAATSKWEAGTVASGNGTVTTINTGSGLTGGPIVNSGTISVAPGGITDGHLATGINPAKLSGTRDATKYLKGDNTWSSFQADLLATILNGFTSITGQTVSNSDSVLGAFGKLQGQVSTLTTNKLDKTGGTLIVGTIDGVPVPVLPSQIVNKQYVDDLVGGVNSSQWTTDAPHIYYNTGNVGIGTSAPGSPLTVKPTNTAATTTPGLWVDMWGIIPTTSNADANAFYSEISSQATQPVNSIINLNLDTGHTTSEDALNIYGIQNYVSNGGSGSHSDEIVGITSRARAHNFSDTDLLIGARISAEAEVNADLVEGVSVWSSNGAVTTDNRGVAILVTGAGTIANQSGLHVMMNGAGTKTNRYGIYLAAPGGTAATNDFGIYQVGTQKNYFNGNLGIGTTSPRSKLEVVGGMQIGADAATCDATKGGTLRYNATNVEYCNGTLWQAFGVSGAGITSLNGSTSATQTFATGTTGTGPAWSTAVGVHTLNIPFASAAGVTGGLLSKTDYDAFDAKLGTATAFSGDVSGAYNTTSVDKIKGQGVVPVAYAAKQVLRYDGTNWVNAQLSATTDLTGTLPVANGGTGLSALTGNRIYRSNALGTAFESFTCSDTELLSFNALGEPICSTNAGAEAFVQNGNSFAANAVLGTNDSFPLSFETNGTAKMSILANGNIGIGTTSPQRKLHLSGGGLQLTNSTVGEGVNDGFVIDYNSNDVTFSNRRTSGKLRFGTNGFSNHFVVNDNGNVGIGTVTPAVALHVDVGSTNVRFDVPASDNLARNGLVLWRSRSDSTSPSAGFGVGVGMGLEMFTNGSIVTAGEIHTVWENNITNNTSDLDSSITFRNLLDGVGSEKMRISSAGNVGIGTTSPTAKLEVAGQVKITGGAPGAGKVLTSDAVGLATWTTPGGADNLGDHIATQNIRLDSYWLSGDGGNEGIRIDSLGNVGIGSSSPQGRLYVAAPSGSDGITLANSSLASRSWMLYPVTNGTATNMRLYEYGDTNGDRMTFQAGGNVGIGTTSPASRLSVTGNLSVGTYSSTAAPTNGLIVSGHVGIGTSTVERKLDITSIGNASYSSNSGSNASPTPNGSYPSMRVKSAMSGNSYGAFYELMVRNADAVYQSAYIGAISNGGATVYSPSIVIGHQTGATSYFERLRIDSIGNVGIGTSTPGYKLDVSGVINATSALRVAGIQVCTSAGCTSSSDERLKENIRPLENALENILKLQGVEYDYIDKTKFSDKRHIGVIAQDVESVYPEVVLTDEKSGFKSVAYDHLVAPLIEAVKSLYLIQTNQSREIASKADNKDVEALKIENEELKKENEEIKARLRKIEEALKIN